MNLLELDRLTILVAAKSKQYYQEMMVNDMIDCLMIGKRREQVAGVRMLGHVSAATSCHHIRRLHRGRTLGMSDDRQYNKHPSLPGVPRNSKRFMSVTTWHPSRIFER